MWAEMVSRALWACVKKDRASVWGNVPISVLPPRTCAKLSCSLIPLRHVSSHPWMSHNGVASGGSMVWWWHTVGQRPGCTFRLSPCQLCDSSTSVPCPACDQGRRAQGNLLTVAALMAVTALRRHCVPSMLPAWLSLCGSSRGRWGTFRNTLVQGDYPRGGSRFGLQGPGVALCVGAQHGVSGGPRDCGRSSSLPA